MDKIWSAIKSHKNILILGFGREGQSTYTFIRHFDKERILTIADASEGVRENSIFHGDKNVRFIAGKKYLENLSGYDCIIKTPGISLPDATLASLSKQLTSQAGLFLEAYRDQTIGVTGTKGKSTTASFIRHTFSESGKKSVLLGNIGVPPFDMLEKIAEDTMIVFELSSHMLQTVSVSPHIALVLNIFPEHLDYYETMERYTASKAHIFQYQNNDDILVMDTDPLLLEAVIKYGTRARRITWETQLDSAHAYAPRVAASGDLVIKSVAGEIPFRTKLTKTSVNGEHVLRGLCLAGVAACYAGAEPAVVAGALETFQGLSHRLENIGQWKGVTFINDSISTIPESALAGLKAFPSTNVLVIGGLDRGISYAKLIDTITHERELSVLCIDETGERIYAELLPYQQEPKKYFLLSDLESAVKKSYEILPKGGTVLLSPAAASYTQFKNFEERGKAFAAYAKKYGI